MLKLIPKRLETREDIEARISAIEKRRKRSGRLIVAVVVLMLLCSISASALSIMDNRPLLLKVHVGAIAALFAVFIHLSSRREIHAYTEDMTVRSLRERIAGKCGTKAELLAEETRLLEGIQRLGEARARALKELYEVRQRLKEFP